MEKPIIEVDGSKAEKTIKELRAELKKAREEMESASLGSEEFAQATQDVADAQQELKTALNASTISLEDAQKAVNVSGKSYMELTQQMAELKKVWRETTDETAREAIGKNIKKINDELKELDASTGNYQRNVGDYLGALNAFGKQFEGIGKEILSASKNLKTFGKSAKEGLGGLATGFKSIGKALAANPLGALLVIIGLLIPLIQKLADKVSIGRQAMEKLSVVTAALKAPLNLLSKLLTGLIDTIASVADWIIKLADSMGWISQSTKDAMEASKQLTAAEYALEEAEEAVALAEAESAENRAKAADDTKTYAERLDALKKAHDTQAKALQQSVDAAQKYYDAMKANADLAENGKKDDKALREAKIKLLNAQKALSEEERSYYKERKELQSKEKSENAAATKARLEAIKKEREALVALQKKRLDLYELTLKNTKKYNDSLILSERDRIRIEQEYTIEVERLALKRAEVSKQEAINKAKELTDAKLRAETLKEIDDKYAAETRETTEKIASIRIEAIERTAEISAKLIGIGETENALIEASANIAAAKLETLKEQPSIFDILLDPDGAQAEIDANQARLNELSMQLSAFRAQEDESEAEAARRKMALEQEVAAERIRVDNDAAKQEAVNSAKRLKATKATFGGMVDALESWSEHSDAAKRAYKVTATAQTAMNTAEGAMAAYKSMAGIPYVGPALGIAAAAAVVAEGAAQIKNINAADSGSVSSGGSSTSVSSTTADSGQTTTLSSIESAFIESRSEQQEQKVTIVASDIANAYDNYKAVEVANQ